MFKIFFVLIFSLLLTTAFSASVWDGSVASSFAGGTGTQEDPYQIADGSQLAYITVYMATDTNITKGKYGSFEI